MRKVNLQVPSTDGNNFKYLYTTPGLNFSLSSPIGKNHTIKLCTLGMSSSKLISLGESKSKALDIANDLPGPILFTTCREIITNFIRKTNADVYTEKLRLDKLRLVIFDTYCKEINGGNIIPVVKALNVIEKAKGWKLTCPHKIKPNLENFQYTFITDLYLLIASKQWIASPYMFSLYLLLIRILLALFKDKILKPGFKDIDDISNGIAKSKSKTDCYRLGNDMDFLLEKGKQDWRILINHFEEIHEGRVKQHWLSGIDNTAGYYKAISKLYIDGLNKLLKGCAFNKTIGERFEKISKEI